MAKLKEKSGKTQGKFAKTQAKFSQNSTQIIKSAIFSPQDSQNLTQNEDNFIKMPKNPSKLKDFSPKLKLTENLLTYTALSGKLKWQKNIQSISRLRPECPHPGLQNEPPLDSLDPQSLKPFMGSLWIGSGQGLAIKGFGD